MPFTAYMQKQILDWVLGGVASPTRPVGRFFGLASGSPTSVSGSDAPTSSFGTITFAAANSPTGSVTNAAAVTLACSAITTVQAWNLYDHSTSGAGANCLMYGTLTALQTGTAGQTIACNAGGLKIILS
jgi:hypothetical protein